MGPLSFAVEIAELKGQQVYTFPYFCPAMCTLTYIPREDGMIITSNRDEHPSRAADEMIEEKVGDRVIWFPRDAKAHGSWISADNTGRIVCLLNGGLEAHEHDPPYRMSRGILVLDFMRADDPGDFIADFSLGGMEPFTLVWFEAGRYIRDWIWTGKQALIRSHAVVKPLLWTASQLYNEEDTHRKRRMFDEFLKEYPVPSEEQLKEHHAGPQSLENSSSRFDRIRKQTEEDRLPGTISMTQIRTRPDCVDVCYRDLLKNECYEKEFSMHSS